MTVDSLKLESCFARGCLCDYRVKNFRWNADGKLLTANIVTLRKVDTVGMWGQHPLVRDSRVYLRTSIDAGQLMIVSILPNFLRRLV